jgi:2,4-dienoyl-CoA reductase (NADPH2)
MLMADPETPNKLASGRAGDIAPCTACDDCSKNLMQGTPIRCRVNAALGGDEEYVIRPAEKKKKVVVVGGGPAGMEAARVAAIRKHEVILYEKEPKLGGLLPWVALVKGNDADRDANTLVDYLKAQITKLGVRIKLGEEFTSSQLGEVKPDAVILATGGIPVAPDVPGVKGSNVLSVEELHDKLKSYEGVKEGRQKVTSKTLDAFLGEKVVIMGGSLEAITLAAFLVERGRNVTVVHTGKFLPFERPIPEEFMFMLLGYRPIKKPVLIQEAGYEEITDKGLTVTTKEGKKQTIEADTIIHALTPTQDTGLLKAFEGKAPEVYIASGIDDKGQDCIMDAVGSGYRIAKAI